MSPRFVWRPRTYSTRECLTRAALRALLVATLLASVAPLSALAPAPQVLTPPAVMRIQPAAPAVDLP